MSSVETGQMSAVESGQMSAAETGQMSAVETRRMYSIGTCSQDQHAQAQHWLRQAQLMHAQHWPRTQMRTRQGGRPPLPRKTLGPRPMLSMHELSLPEPMMSLSILTLATYPEAALDVTILKQNQN